MNLKKFIQILIFLCFSYYAYSQKKPIDYSIESSKSSKDGDYAKSIKILDEGILKFPNYAMFYVDRGIAKFKFKLYADAIVDYTQALKVDSSILLAYYYRSESKVYLKDIWGAISDLDNYIDKIHLLKSDVDLSNTFFNRGLLKIQINKLESGCLDLSKAGELGYSRAYEYIKKYCQ